MSKKAVGYIRVSTEEQAKDGQGLASQRKKIRAYAESQSWKLVEIYCDSGYSGKSIDRPELARLLNNIKTGAVDIVLVYKVDRLTRRQRDLWYLLEDCLEPFGVGFKSVTESFDTTTATGKAFLSMLGTFAQLERDTTAERTRDTLKSKKAKGEWMGRIPFGFRIGRGGSLEKDPDQQKTIARIKRLRRRGHSIRSIAGTVDLGKSTVCKLINKHGRTRNGQYSKTFRA